MATIPYALAHKARKPKDKSKIVIEGLNEPKRDPMTGITDPRKLLKAPTQRIDPNVIDPFAPRYPKGPGASELVEKI